METGLLEMAEPEVIENERPSEEFVRMVADLLETDANDILTELGYSYGRSVVEVTQTAEV